LRVPHPDLTPHTEPHMLVGSDGTLMLRRALWDLSVGVGVDQLCAHHGLPRSHAASASVARRAGASDWSTRQTGTGTGLAGSACQCARESESARREAGCEEPERVHTQREASGRGSESDVDADMEGLGGACEAIRAEVVTGLENELPTLAQ
jgi:hypothetical protein